MAEEFKSDDTTPIPGQDSDDIIYIPPATPPTVVVQDSDSDSTNKSWKTNQKPEPNEIQSEIPKLNGFNENPTLPPSPSVLSSEFEKISNEMKIEIDDFNIPERHQVENHQTIENNDNSSESDANSPPKTNPLAIELVQSDDETSNDSNLRDGHLSPQEDCCSRILYINSEPEDLALPGDYHYSPTRLLFINSEVEGGDSALTTAVLDKFFNQTRDVADNGKDLDDIPSTSHGSVSEQEKESNNYEGMSNKPDGETRHKYSRKTLPKKITCLNCGVQGHKTCDCTVPFKIPCDLCGSLDHFIRCAKCGSQFDNKCICFMEKSIAFCSKCRLDLNINNNDSSPNNNHQSNSSTSSSNYNIEVKKRTEFQKTLDDSEDSHYMRPKQNWFSQNAEGYRLPRLSKSFPKNYHKTNNERSLGFGHIDASKMILGISDNISSTNFNNLPGVGTITNLIANNVRKVSTVESTSDELEIIEETHRGGYEKERPNTKSGPKKDITYVLSSDPEGESPKRNQSKQSNDPKAGPIVIDSESDVSVEASCSRPTERRSNGIPKYNRFFPTRPRYPSTSSESDNSEGESNIQKTRRKRMNPLAIVIEDSDYDGDEDTPPSKSPKQKTPLPLKKRKTSFPKRLSVDKEDGIEMGIDIDNTFSGQYPTHVPNIKRGPAIEKYNTY